jgi:hypothetical protein
MYFDEKEHWGKNDKKDTKGVLKVLMLNLEERSMMYV